MNDRDAGHLNVRSVLGVGKQLLQLFIKLLSLDRGLLNWRLLAISMPRRGGYRRLRASCQPRRLLLPLLLQRGTHVGSLRGRAHDVVTAPKRASLQLCRADAAAPSPNSGNCGTKQAKACMACLSGRHPLPTPLWPSTRKLHQKPPSIRNLRSASPLPGLTQRRRALLLGTSWSWPRPQRTPASAQRVGGWGRVFLSGIPYQWEGRA